jgi:DNA replication and repair protein RecF
MALTRIDLTDFRNHASLSFRPQGRLIALYGANGAGKTNILEAVSLLVPGRGLRRAALAEMVGNDGGGGFAVSAELADSQIGTALQPATPTRRQVHINGAVATINDLAERLSILWLTPAMDRIFAEGAAARRRFLDRLVLALVPGHALASSRYENALRQRNRMLSEGQGDAVWFDAIEASLAEYGAMVAAARLQTVEQLAATIAAMPDLPFARPMIALDAPVAMEPEMLQMALAAGRVRDRAAGRTLSGPHRSDLLVHHAGHGAPAASCSTGEQKALLLSLILAHAALVKEKRGEPPILLLDEVAAHLDPDRRAALYALLADTGGQVWMSGTEAGLFDTAGSHAQRVHIADGKLEG